MIIRIMGDDQKLFQIIQQYTSIARDIRTPAARSYEADGESSIYEEESRALLKDVEGNLQQIQLNLDRNNSTAYQQSVLSELESQHSLTSSAAEHSSHNRRQDPRSLGRWIKYAKRFRAKTRKRHRAGSEEILTSQEEEAYVNQSGTSTFLPKSNQPTLGGRFSRRTTLDDAAARHTGVRVPGNGTVAVDRLIDVDELATPDSARLGDGNDGTCGHAEHQRPSKTLYNDRTKHQNTEAYAKGLKYLDFQVCVTIIEARQLAGLNIDPVVCVQVGEQKKFTSVKESTNCPYYNEYFVFDFYMPAQLFFDQIITITVFQSRSFIRKSAVVGSFKLDVHTVYTQLDHQFYHKWALLTDPDDLLSGPKGYVKCNISVLGRGETIKAPPKTEKDEDDIEANLLLPQGIATERQRARYTIKIYKAEGLPSTSTGLMSNFKKAIAGGDSARHFVDPYVEVTFAGKLGRTSVKKNTNRPIWNEQLVFTEMFPPLVRRIKIQIRDDSLNKDVLATHFLDLSSISDEGRRGAGAKNKGEGVIEDSGKGFLPVFGPAYINMYGSTRDINILGDKTAALNAGLGEGVAYRGRILVAFKCDLVENVHDTSAEALVEPCLAVSENSLGKMEEFFLFACLMDTSMIDRKLTDKSMTLELSMGAAGLPDGNDSDSDSDDEKEDSLSHLSKPSWRSTTPALKPVTRDQSYCYIPYGEDKPCLYVRANWCDQRRRMYNSNALKRLHEKLEMGLLDVGAALDRETPNAEIQMKMGLESFANDCSRYLVIVRNFANQGSGQNKLDKERFRMCQREIDAISGAARNLRMSITKENAKEKLGEAYAFIGRIKQLTLEPQHALPDVFLWLLASNKRIAYQRFQAEDLIFSGNDLERGKLCRSLQSFFLKVPGGRGQELSQTQAQVTAFIWLGLNKQKTGFLSGLTKGYSLTREVTEAEKPQNLPPPFITYSEQNNYELRCHLYLARDLIGLDESGLSDPFARVIFEGHSATTQVIEQTLNPAWDEMLLFKNVVLYGDPADIQSSAPPIVIQIYDQDQVGKSEFMGQALASCIVKLAGEKYDRPKFPPPLVWFPVYRGSERCGEILAAFELLQLRPDNTCQDYPMPPMPNRQGDLEPIMPVPPGIRPLLGKYRMEVLFWGLRDMKRVNLTLVDRPRVDVECAGKMLSSSVITNYKKNPNFTAVVKSFDVELPDDPMYWPPVIIRCVDCKNFGRFVLIGTHTINAIDKYMHKHVAVVETPEAKHDNKLAPKSFIIDIDGEPAIISADGATSSDPLARTKPGSVSPKKDKSDMTDEDFDNLDWWSKYYASVEYMIEQQREAEKKAQKLKSKEDDPLPGKKRGAVSKLTHMKVPKIGLGHSRSVPGSSNSSPGTTRKMLGAHTSPTKEAKRKTKHSDKIAKMEIFRSELEKQEEFEGFHDWLNTFDLYRGKKTTFDTEDDGRVIGRFKGTLKICKYPLPPEYDKTFFKHVPSNDPINVLVRMYIVKAHDLHPADINGKADPYVVLTLGRNKVNDKENYISKQLNPVFGKCFEMEVIFPMESQLSVQIYDWDLVGLDDLIGETRIDLENRYYSRHRGTAGLTKRYEMSGYNMWRDPQRPSQVLAKLCKDYHLDGPFYSPGLVRVGGKCFYAPKPESGKGEFSLKKNNMWTFGHPSGNKLDSEPMALHALHNWAEVPKVGCPLVPEHVETRALYHPDKPGIEQGRLEMWVDMFPMDMPSPPPPVDISPRKPKSYELRVIIWNTEDVVLEDDAFFTGEKMSDIYVKGFIKGPEDTQCTDIHYRSLTGEGNFNWRFVFPFDYLEAEEKIVISRKESVFSWDESETKVPARLQLQVWDADHFSADDWLGSMILDLNRFPRGAKSARQCSLAMFKEHLDVPMISIFKQHRVKGWWPFAAKSEVPGGEMVLTGKVEAEFHLLSAEDAEKSPAGLGRNEPEPLEKPNRPDTSFMWFLSPLKSIKYILWYNYKYTIIKVIIALLFIVMLALFIYAVPGYAVKRMMGA